MHVWWKSNYKSPLTRISKTAGYGMYSNGTAGLELNIHRQDQESYTVDVRYTDSDLNSQTDVRLGCLE